MVRSIIFWGGIMPILLFTGVLLSLIEDSRWWIVTLVIPLGWVLRMVQLTQRQVRRGLLFKVARASGVLLMIGKVPQFLGLMAFHGNRLIGRKSALIEYKGSEPV
jgi:hypothetical protein